RARPPGGSGGGGGGGRAPRWQGRRGPAAEAARGAAPRRADRGCETHDGDGTRSWLNSPARTSRSRGRGEDVRRYGDTLTEWRIPARRGGPRAGRRWRPPRASPRRGGARAGRGAGGARR